MNAPELSQPEPPRDWQRVSPVSLLYFAFSAARQAVNFWPALVPLLAGGERLRYLFWWYGTPALVVSGLLSVWAYYWFFRFREEEDRIQLRTGLLNRNRLTLHFERVQQADIIQPYYFRPFGLATLGLESAGSVRQEVSIPGIPYATAVRLKKTILQHKRQPGGATDTPQADASVMAPEFRLRLPPLEVARYGLMHNGLLFMLPVIGAFSQQFTGFLQSLVTGLRESRLFDSILDYPGHGGDWLAPLGIGLLVVGGFCVLSAASAIIALVRYWNYTLVRRGDRFQYRAGLGTLRTRGFLLHKLQKVTVSQGVVARLLRRYSVAVSKTGSAVLPACGGQGESGKFIVPVLDKPGLQRFLRQLECPDAIDAWTPVSRFFIVWHSLWIGVPSTAISALGLNLMGHPPWLAVFVAGAVVAAVWRHWHCYGVFRNDHWFAVKTGFIGRKIVLFPSVKTQKVTVSQPPWLRRCSLANLSIWSGGGLIAVPHLPQQFAGRVRGELLEKASGFRGRWF